MKRTIFILLLILPFTPIGAPPADMALGDDRGDDPGVTISANKSVFRPGDTMRISISATASRRIGEVVDLYIVVRNPDGGFSTFCKEPEWVVVDEPLHEIASIPLKNKRIGPYTWGVVLCIPGNDLFDTNGWIAGANTELFLLPDNQASKAEAGPALTSPDADLPPLIAHAGGAFGGRVVQNSREALDHNHQKGRRYFEIDFCWTSDNRLVLIHDWEMSFTRLFENAGRRPTLERFEAMRMKHGMTQMSLDALLLWLSKHPDARIITDLKERNSAALKRIAGSAGNLKKRFIPQIYAPPEFELARSLGFEKVIFTLYRSPLSDAEVVQFASNHELFAVTMSAHRAFSPFPIRDLNREGVPVYVHTINEIEIFHFLRGKGVHGIYTDKIQIEDLYR